MISFMFHRSPVSQRKSARNCIVQYAKLKESKPLVTYIYFDIQECVPERPWLCVGYPNGWLSVTHSTE